MPAVWKAIHSSQRLALLSPDPFQEFAKNPLQLLAFCNTFFDCFIVNLHRSSRSRKKRSYVGEPLFWEYSSTRLLSPVIPGKA